MALQRDLHEQVSAMAEQLRQAAYGKSGSPQWGTSFTDLESLAVDLGDTLAQLFVSQAAQQQAQERPAESCTCTCGHEARRRIVKEEPAHEARVIATRRGEATWLEEEYYCDRCRKSFFPSVESVGHRSGRHG